VGVQCDVLTWRRSAAGVIAVCVASALGWWVGDTHRSTRSLARVIEAIDGDTVVVVFASGRRDTVRILGVDTPKVA